MSVELKSIWNLSQLERIRCDCCACEDTRLVCIRPDGLRVEECRKCGLAFVNPRPKISQIQKLYEEDYFKKPGCPAASIGYADYESWAGGVQQNDPPHEMEILSRYRPIAGADLLEIGCATGHFLLAARKAGACAVGLEVSQYAAAIASDRYGLDVHVGAIDTVPWKGASFDVVVALELVEHVLSPTDFFRRVRELLRPRAVLLLSTPNYACARELGERWLGFQTSFEHLFFFTREVLNCMTGRIGFRELYCETSGNCTSPQTAGPAFRRTLRRAIATIPGARLLWRWVQRRPDRWVRFGWGHRLLAIYEKV